MEGDCARCLPVGMDDYLTKPFTLTQLKAVLTQWLLPKPTLATASDLPTAAELPEPPAGDPDQPIAQGIDKTTWAAIQALQRPGRPDILARVLATYLEDSRRLVEQIRVAVQSQDPVTLRQAAHRLKSSSGQLGDGDPLQGLGGAGTPGPVAAGRGALGATHPISSRSVRGHHQRIADPRGALTRWRLSNDLARNESLQVLAPCRSAASSLLHACEVTPSTLV